jgi:hypothetical protein
MNAVDVHRDPFLPRASTSIAEAIAESISQAIADGQKPPMSGTFAIRLRRTQPPPAPILEDEVLDSWFR